MLKKILAGFIIGLVLNTPCVNVQAATDGKNGTDGKNFPSLLNNASESPRLKMITDSLYNIMGLAIFGLERDVFYNAFKGYEVLLSKNKLKKPDLLTICDYSQSSNNQRLYVINLKEGRLLFNTLVSHGKNSGGEYATSFSNLNSSNKSSLGFMVTGETYRGKAGYSMRFDGMEQGINDKVRQRDIVLHGSAFVNPGMVEQRGVIGNSLGCPAVPLSQHKQIIDAIKNGSCFFINHPDSWYVRTSAILNAKFDLVPTASALANGNSATAAPTPAAQADGTITGNSTGCSF